MIGLPNSDRFEKKRDCAVVVSLWRTRGYCGRSRKSVADFEESVIGRGML